MNQQEQMQRPIEPAAPPVEMTAEMMQAEIERAREREERRVQALDDIGQSLERHKEEAVKWRSTYEAQWIEDYNQYNGRQNALGDTKREGSTGTPADEEAYRRTRDNITRPKVIITAARLGDMLFPTNDSNFSVESSPNPDVPLSLLPPPPSTKGESGEEIPGQYDQASLKQAMADYARKAAAQMFITIKDQFEECQYAESGRAAIFDGTLYGTGVLRGPRVKRKRRRRWANAEYEATSPKTMNLKPAVELVDLWSFFPQPSRNIDECEHAFVLHLLPPRSVRKLVDQPGFDKAQIKRLLELAPDHGALGLSVASRGIVRPDVETVLTGRYTVWEYSGPMPKTAFAAFAAGLAAQGVIDDNEAAELSTFLENEPMAQIDCEVWFSQGVVIKMAVSTLSRGELGFHVFNYEKDPNSIFGRGVAYLCRDDQIAANQLWHAIMLNSMMSAGPQIGVRQGALVPMTGEGGAAGRNVSLSATKPRVWAMNSEVKDIRAAMSVFIIPNVTQQLMGVYERAKANADEHTMTPMVAQGEPSSVVPTSSGMAMIMNAANVVMRRLAKSWDDDITVPLVGEFYEWNMENNPDDSIKGDYCVIPKGASHLLIKDVQAQHLQFATTMFSNNPILQPYMKAGVFARRNIEMLDMSPDEMLNTDEQVEQSRAQQGEQPNPEVIKAQAAQGHAEAAAKKADTEAQIAQARMEFDRWERQLQHEEKMAELQARTSIQEMQLQGQQVALAHKLAEMEKDERVAMQEIMADLRKHGMSDATKRYQADLGARLGAEKIAQQDSKVATEVSVESPNPRLA